jgi:ABC-type xylose transport system permease subunit
MSVDPNFVYIIKGIILLLAILLDVLGKRRGAARV